jgi:hypothetical protein
MIVYNLRDPKDKLTSIGDRLFTLSYCLHKSITEYKPLYVSWKQDPIYSHPNNYDTFAALFKIYNIEKYDEIVTDSEYVGLEDAIMHRREFEDYIPKLIKNHIMINRACVRKAKEYCEQNSVAEMAGVMLKITSSKSVVDVQPTANTLVKIFKEVRNKPFFVISDVNLGQTVFGALTSGYVYLEAERAESFWNAHIDLTELVILSQCEPKHFYRCDYLEPVIEGLEYLIR